MNKINLNSFDLKSFNFRKLIDIISASRHVLTTPRGPVWCICKAVHLNKYISGIIGRKLTVNDIDDVKIVVETLRSLNVLGESFTTGSSLYYIVTLNQPEEIVAKISDIIGDKPLKVGISSRSI